MQVLTRTAYRKRRKMIKRTLGSFILLVALMTCCVAAIFFYAYELPPPSLSVPESTVLFSKDEDVIGEFYADQNRHWISLDDMADSIIEATIAVEDRRFYDHYGFDFFRIGGAILTNIRTGRKAEGASTITQQYARNLFLNHEKTWSRKLHEAFYALRLELHYSKNEILEGYLNTIYYGHGAYGIEAAANVYFQKHAEDLTTAEAAMLAGIPKGPNIFSPFIDEKRAKERQEVVLLSMENAGFITAEERIELTKEELVFAGDNTMKGKKIAPYFQAAVFNWLTDELGLTREEIEHGGLEVHTTLDLHLQKLAEEIVLEELGTEGDLQVAFVAQDPLTGNVLALIGGRDYDESNFNRATQAKRHPGSTIKPLLYYAALENGLRPNSMLKSEQTKFIYDEGRGEFVPSNYNGKFANDYITMLQALAVSDNIYATKIHFLLGFETLVETAKRFGIESPLEEHPSLALGAQDVNILEMMNSYNMFANGGYRVFPQFVTKVVDRDGNVLYEAEEHLSKELSPQLTAIMTNMMQGMFEDQLSTDYAAVTGRSIAHLLEHPTAGKSGSTAKDSWMIGFSPQLLSGVWVGYDHSKDLETGDAVHSKNIWAKFMNRALAGETQQSFPVPANLVEVEINPVNGKLATEECPVKRATLFYPGTEPTEYCTDHTSEKEVDEEQLDPLQKTEEEKRKKWLDRFRDWFSYHEQG